MSRWCLLLLFVALAGCSLLPEEHGPTQKISGKLVFREETALPPTATAHVVIVSAAASAGSKPIAQGDFPARTGTEIPFQFRVSAAAAAAEGECLILAQVVDHGKVWYSNLSSPMRISFVAEPSDVVIELRPERM